MGYCTESIVVLGRNRDYVRIFTDLESVRKGFTEMKGNLNPQKFIECLFSSESIPARNFRMYGGKSLEMIGGTENLQTDIVAFFKEAESYRNSHGADYALVENFNFEMAGKMRRVVSADVRLLLEDRL